MATPFSHLPRAFLRPLLILITGLCLTTANSQTINWGSAIDSLIVDNKGTPLDPSPGSFQIGRAHV